MGPRTAYCVLLATSVLLGSGVCADPSEALKPLLIRLPGWETDAVEVLDVKKGIIRTTTLQRTYYKGEAEMVALLMATSRTTIDRKIQELRAECKGDKMTEAKLDGFQVHTFYSAADKAGVIVVILNQGPSRAAMLCLNFDGIDGKQALALAKKFNWKEMQTATVRM